MVQVRKKRQNVVKAKSSSLKRVLGRVVGLPWLERFTTFRVLSAQAISWHTHPAHEWLFCLKGLLSYEFKDGRVVSIGTGTSLLIPAGVEHRIVGGIDTPSKRCSMFLSVEMDRFERLNGLSRNEYQLLVKTIRDKGIHPIAMTSRSISNLNRIAEKVENWQELDQLEKIDCRVAILSVLSDCAQNAVLPDTPTCDIIMDSATEYLRQHYAEKFTLKLLIKKIGYGRTRFFELFKARYGVTPNEWLNRYRIEKAKSLLSSADPMTIATVGKSVGFSDAAFFSRVFRRYEGRAPSAFG